MNYEWDLNISIMRKFFVGWAIWARRARGTNRQKLLAHKFMQTKYLWLGLLALKMHKQTNHSRQLVKGRAVRHYMNRLRNKSFYYWRSETFHRSLSKRFQLFKVKDKIFYMLRVNALRVRSLVSKLKKRFTQMRKMVIFRV
jgi:hypothetical protein